MRFFVNEEYPFSICCEDLHLSVREFKEYLDRFEEDTIVDFENDHGTVSGRIDKYSYTDDDEKIVKARKIFFATFKELQKLRGSPESTPMQFVSLISKLEVLTVILGDIIPKEYREYVKKFV